MIPQAAQTSSSAARRVIWVMAILTLCLAAIVLLRLYAGYPFGWPTMRAEWEPRLLRLCGGLIVGVALATGGVALQALLRNPLAEPFILGLSTGAGVGVMAQMLLAHYVQKPIGPTHLGALAGALISMFVVYLGGRRRGVIDPLGLLLIGVVLGTINGAVILLLNFLPGTTGLREDISRWMMGYLNEGVSTATLVSGAVIVGAGFAILVARARAMDVATFSDAEAQSLGVNLPVLRTLLFVLASLLAATAVVLAGPIAFVGLICPHLARLLLGPSHRPLLLAAAMIGAILIIFADFVSVALDVRYQIGRLPIGIFTAIAGGLMFLWMLRPSLGRGAE